MARRRAPVREKRAKKEETKKKKKKSKKKQKGARHSDKMDEGEIVSYRCEPRILD